MDNRYLEGDDLKSRIASRKTASLHATPVVVSFSGALAVLAAPDMSGAFVRQTVQASPSGVPAAKVAVERPDNATLSGRLKIILGIADSLADSMDERGTQYGDLLRDHLKDSGLLGLLKTERFRFKLRFRQHRLCAKNVTGRSSSSITLHSAGDSKKFLES